MAIPTFDQLIEPLLRVLGSAPNGLPATEVRRLVAERIELDQADLEELLPSGLLRFPNRVGWAHDRLKRAGLSQSVQRGVWALTEAGHAMVAATPSTPLDVDAIMKMGLDNRASLGGTDERAPEKVAPPEEHLSPTERIEAAVEEFNESLRAELLQSILRSSPAFFERLVLDVLRAMGYGASSADVNPTGGSGDGGIDGIITLDRLGLEKVYVQAKRYADNPVGRPEIQGFFGALTSRRATKGVFITASRFTREASEFAQQASDSLVLIDGAQLTRYMIEYGVGVFVERTLRLCRLDSDYFEDE